MSVSQNTENEQQNNLCTTLTEQWKKGELEAGWYYVLLFSNEEYITFIDGNWVVDDRLIGADIKEVLAPVPSYQEWQRTFHYAGKYEHEYTSCVMDYENLKQEYQQLKDILREWLQFEIEENPNDFTVISERMSELANKTKQAIGEKK